MATIPVQYVPIIHRTSLLKIATIPVQYELIIHKTRLLKIAAISCCLSKIQPFIPTLTIAAIIATSPHKHSWSTSLLVADIGVTNISQKRD
jgi:hypothetical protein